MLMEHDASPRFADRQAALAALIEILAGLRDAQGNTTIEGLDATGTWHGDSYPTEQFRSDAGVLDGVDSGDRATVTTAMGPRRSKRRNGVPSQSPSGGRAAAASGPLVGSFIGQNLASFA